MFGRYTKLTVKVGLTIALVGFALDMVSPFVDSMIDELRRAR